MDENDSLYCIKCGKQLRAGAKFCNACGTKVPILDEPAPQPIPEPMIAPALQPAADKQSAKKGGKGGVFALILAVLSLSALVTLIIICPEIYTEYFEAGCAGVAAAAVTALICFIVSRKNKAGVIGGVLSVIVLAGVGGYAFWYIPHAKDQFHEEFMDELKSVSAVSSKSSYSEGSNAYPYSSASMFYFHERKNKNSVLNYLNGLYEKNELEKWVAAGQYINSKGIEKIYEGDGIDHLIAKASEIDPAILSGYTVFEDTKTPVGKASMTSNSSGVGRMKSDLLGRIDQVRDYENGRNTIMQSYGGRFYMIGGVLLYRDGYGLVAVDLSNGNYFCSGDWL